MPLVLSPAGIGRSLAAKTSTARVVSVFGQVSLTPRFCSTRSSASFRRPASRTARLSPPRTACSPCSPFSVSAASMGSTLRANDPAKPFKVLVVGGSYAGLSVALNLHDLCLGKVARSSACYVDKTVASDPIHAEITIVDERDGFYHVIGSPLVFASKPYADKAWLLYKDVPALQQAPNISTVHASVTGIDFAAKTATVKAVADGAVSTLDYDFVFVTTGMRRAYPSVPQSRDKASYLAEVGTHVDSVAGKEGVLVVGGGAVGIEMAAELKLVQPDTRVVLAHSRSRLMSSEPLPDEVSDATVAILRENGVEVLLEHRLQDTKDLDDGTKEVTFANGNTLRVNTVVVAISKYAPAVECLPREAVNDEGYIKVQADLTFPASIPNHEYAYAAGDNIDWSGIKRCGRAMHMGYKAAINAHQRMQELTTGKAPEFLLLQPIAPVLAIALGKNAVCWVDKVTSGKDVAAGFFEDDVGFMICYRIMGLGGYPVEEAKA